MSTGGKQLKITNVYTDGADDIDQMRRTLLEMATLANRAVREVSPETPGYEICQRFGEVVPEALSGLRLLAPPVTV